MHTEHCGHPVEMITAFACLSWPGKVCHGGMTGALGSSCGVPSCEGGIENRFIFVNEISSCVLFAYSKINHTAHLE